MQAGLFLGAIVSTLIFLQGVPAPPMVVWGIAPLIVGGGSYGIVAASIADEAKRKKNSKRTRRQQLAFEHARKMVREVSAEMDKNRDGPGPAPPGVPQYNWDDCFHQARKSKISVEGPVGDRGIRAIGLPPVCMNLAVVLGGVDNVTAVPIPCGSDCMDWVHMTAGYYDGIRRIINTKMLEMR